MGNKEVNMGNVQEQMWTVEQLEPKLLLSADLMPSVHEISGNIDKPGEQKQYEFVVTEKTKFFFDGVEGAKFNWSLKGKEFGQEFSTVELAQDSHKFLDLVPDTYQLTVDGEDDKTGSYSFRILGESAALVLLPNQPTNIKLDPSSQAVLYKIDLSKGDRVFFENQISNATWSIFDPNAQIVKNRLNTLDNQGFEVIKSGTYWLSIDSSESSHSLETSFVLHVSQPEITSLNLNEKKEIIFNKPFESKQFSFTLEQDQWIGFDQLTQGLENTEWLIKDENGNSIFSEESTTQSDNIIPPKFLKSGKYVLEFNSLNNTIGKISFVLKSSSKVDHTIDDTHKSLILNNNENESKFIKINSGSNDLVSLITQKYFSEIENTNYIDLENILEKLINSNFSANGYELFELQLNKNDKLSFEKDQEDALIRIFDKDGNEVIKSNSNELNFNVINAGLYYMGVSATQNNNYNIHEKSENEKNKEVLIKIKYQSAIKNDYQFGDVGGSIYTAQRLDFVKTKKLQVVIGDNNSNYADTDFYKIKVKRGDIINISTPNGVAIDGYLKIFDGNGYQLTATDDSPLSYTFNATGEYYLAFSSYSGRYYSPYSENSGGSGNVAKGTINVDIELTTNENPKLYLLDSYGNLIVDTDIRQLDLLQTQINSNEEYYLWINFSSKKSIDFSYTIGMSNQSRDKIELNESKKIEYTFDSIAQSYNIELNVTEAGTYIIYPGINLVNAKWKMSGPGVQDLEWSNDVLQGKNLTQAVYLTKGTYKLSISNYDAIGEFELNFISSQSLEVLVSEQNYTIDSLLPRQFVTYAIDSKYLDEYTFKLASNYPDLNIIVWDQYGQLMTSHLTDGTNIYQDYKQNKIYVSVINESLYKTIEGINLKYEKVEHTQPINIVKTISLNQEIELLAKDLPRNVNYDFKLENDSFVSFEFLENIYENVSIIGPQGEIFSNDDSKVSGQWLVAGQYFIEFKNKIKNTDFKFKIRNIDQYTTLDENVLTNIDLEFK